LQKQQHGYIISINNNNNNNNPRGKTVTTAAIAKATS
jgi:hypothetical protein